MSHGDSHLLVAITKVNNSSLFIQPTLMKDDRFKKNMKIGEHVGEKTGFYECERKIREDKGRVKIN